MWGLVVGFLRGRGGTGLGKDEGFGFCFVLFFSQTKYLNF